ncbi:MAG: FeoB-associated Cys-rich membrane protein [Desulfobacteraceae bacterium]|nr:FeoB-associated Cys-rich membrane protein [Desulfobacteraceae bacterium]
MQKILVILIVAAAAWYLASSCYKRVKNAGESGNGCGCSEGCGVCGQCDDDDGPDNRG